MHTHVHAKNLKQIKAISFDLDDTLWDNGPVIKKAVSQSLEYLNKQLTLGQLVTQEELIIAYKKAINKRAELAFRLTELRQVCYEIVLIDKGIPSVEANTIATKATELFVILRQEVEPWPEAIQLLKTLAPHFRLIAITNGNCDVYQTSIGKYFNLYISPLEASAAKPDPAIYAYASKKIDIAPEQILHIGDCETNDIQGAKEAGFNTLWFNPDQKQSHNKLSPDYQVQHLSEIESLLLGR